MSEFFRRAREAEERRPPDRATNHDHPEGVAEYRNMGSTFYSLHVHVVFSTKERSPIIADAWRSRLHAYVGGVLRGMDAKPLEVGGVEDHIHILVGTKPSHCLSDMIRELKKESTKWVRANGNPSFSWQEGYAAFAVSTGIVSVVKTYIVNQPEHHKKFSYEEELKALLDEAGIPYEDRFLV